MARALSQTSRPACKIIKHGSHIWSSHLPCPRWPQKQRQGLHLNGASSRSLTWRIILYWFWSHAVSF